MHSKRRIAIVFGLAAVMTALVLLGAQAAAPLAVIEVDSTADALVAGNDECTLREAINNANTDSDTTAGDCAAGSEADTIMLPAGTYTLTIAGPGEDDNASGDLDILDPDGLTIEGAGAATTVIDGNALDRVLHQPGPFEPQLTLNRLTISGGRVTGTPGGGILVQGGSLTLNQTVVQNNVSDGGNGGGGIYARSVVGDRVVTIRESTLRGNQALGPAGFTGLGGGAFLIGVEVVIDRSTVVSNTGQRGAGGLLILDGDGTVANSTISGNTTVGDPGDPLYGVGGGMLFGQEGSPDPILVSVINTTIAANSAGNWGGGLAVGSIGAFTATVSLVNTIIADNLAPENRNCFNGAGFTPGVLESLGHNLEDADTCQLDQPSDLINTEPLLGPLQDNGGATWTHALGAGSPALEAADDAVCAAPPVNGVDQREVTRPQGAACDIGAFEREPAPPTPTATLPSPTPTATLPPTATPTATPGPPAHRLYLPLAAWQQP
jgi:CSLREA domain-containing protein